eukprot:790744_1
MAHSSFGNKRQCEIPHQDTSKCEAIKRIKYILHEFNDNPLHKDREENESNLMDKFAAIFIDNHYTNTSLLNDFHHVKYIHDADDNDEAFAKIYEYFTDGIGTICNEKQCRFIERHYRDRSVLQNDYILSDEKHDNDEFNPHESRYMMDLISRIHVYFIHSYHINRFTLNEVRRVNEQTDDDTRMQLSTDIMNKKRNIIDINWDNDKFNEPAHLSTSKDNESAIDWTKMHNILQTHNACCNINIAIQDLKTAFSAYRGSDHENRLMVDLIDAYYATNDTSLPLSNAISINSLHNDYTHRHTIYGIILFQYFEKRDITATH